MEVLLTVTVLFALVLALSFVIERFLEILKAIYDLFDSKYDFHKYYTKRTTKVRDKLERKLRIFEYVKPKQAEMVLNRFREYMLKETEKVASKTPVLAGDLVRSVYVKVIGKLVGIGIGIWLAFWMNIDLIAVWRESSSEAAWIEEITSADIRHIISGIIMGLGAGPVHKIITSMEKRRERRVQKGGLA